MANKIAAILLNYNQPRQTVECLLSLLRTDLGHEVDYYVVDNSPDKMFERELKNQLPSINYISSPTNIGFAGGNNLAIRKVLKTDGKYILVINPDVQVGKSFFKPLLADFDRNMHVGLVAPAIRHTQNGTIFFGLQGKVDWKTGKATHTNLRHLPKTKTVKKSEFVTFACVLIKAGVFGKVGLLDEKYFMYLEDVDFCLQAGRSGYDILLDQNVVVDHQTSSSFKKPTDKLIISFQSQILFINKWLRFPSNIFPILHTLLLYPYLYMLWTYHYYKKRFR